MGAIMTARIAFLIKEAMKYLSICSGVEAASVAWHHMGWQPVGFSEIEPFPSAVLKHHYPAVPNYGDMTTLPERILSGEIEAPDLLVGGTPCQAFSVAGLRNSLDDKRGNLSLTFIGIANAIDHIRSSRGLPPVIILWENVPGVFSTKDNAFGCFLAGLAGEGVPLQPAGGKWTNAGAVFGTQRSIAWRTLDAQFFGVAQRRRRCFVVASARKDFNPSTVLFEFTGVRRDIAPSRQAGKNPASFTPSSIGSYREGVGTLRANGGDLGGGSENIITMAHGQGGAEIANDRAPTLTCNHEAPIAIYENHGTDSRIKEVEVCPTVTSRWGTGGNNVPLKMETKAYSFDSLSSNSMKSSNPHSGCRETDLSKTIDTGNPEPSKNQGGIGILQNMAVRRLTPIECERLQGFPDNYTNIPWRKKPESPDSPRYKAMGNSMAVPVMRWIGQRIQSAVLVAHNDNNQITLEKSA